MVQLIRASHTDMGVAHSGHMDRLGKIRGREEIPTEYSVQMAAMAHGN